MKKILKAFLALACVTALAACGSKKQDTAAVEIDYGSSELYTKEDMDEAIKLIQEEFSKWEGCELHSIAYTSDDDCNEDNIAWMNQLEAAGDAKETFTQCIQFKSNFHSPKEGGGAWNPDQEYTDWGWWLARADGGKWKLMTWGY